MPETKKRRQRSNIAGQEEMVSALWALAQEVEDIVKRGNSFKPAQGGEVRISDPQMIPAIGAAMERIAQGFGYRIVEIQ